MSSFTKERVYSFYYTTKSNKLYKNIVETKSCIKPDRTKIYKELGKKLNESDIHSYGFFINS